MDSEERALGAQLQPRDRFGRFDGVRVNVDQVPRLPTFPARWALEDPRGRSYFTFWVDADGKLVRALLSVTQPFAQESLRGMFRLPEWLPILVAILVSGLLAVYKVWILRRSTLKECAICAPLLMFIDLERDPFGGAVDPAPGERVSAGSERRRRPDQVPRLPTLPARWALEDPRGRA